MKLSALIERFDLKTHAPLELDFEIRGVRPLSQASEGDLSFLSNPKYRDQVATTGASAILVKEPVEDSKAVQILCDDPYAMLARVLGLLYPEPVTEPGVHPSAVVHPSATIEEGCYVGPHCVVEAEAHIGAGTHLEARVSVGANVTIGKGCKFFPGVVLYRGVTIGNKVRIHANSVIGSDGFGYAQTKEGHLKVPQIGSVIVEDGVEIGANTTIDRGALDDTLIGAGTIIDNQVQIAHGVKIGKCAIIISQTGISGSSTVGNGSVLAGKAGVVGHVNIGDGVIVMGDSIVTKNLTKPGRYAGNPAIPHIQYQKQLAHMRSLPEIKKRLKALEKQLGETND